VGCDSEVCNRTEAESLWRLWKGSYRLLIICFNFRILIFKPHLNNLRWGDIRQVNRTHICVEHLQCYSVDSHLDCGGPSWPLQVQTLVSKVQEDLETRQRPAVEPVALDFWKSGIMDEITSLWASKSNKARKRADLNEFRRVSLEVAWPLGWFEWKVLLTPRMQIRSAVWLLHSWLSMWAGLMWRWRSDVTAASSWNTSHRRFVCHSVCGWHAAILTFGGNLIVSSFVLTSPFYPKRCWP